MWQAKLLAILSKFAGPLIGAVGALILSLSVALWWTSSQLSTARDTLAESRADMLTCVAANASARGTIRDLQAASIANRALRDAALARQQAALARIEELERNRSEQRDGQIEAIDRAADADACAYLPIADSLRNAARRD